MSHFLNDDQKAIRDVAAKFAANELMPIANEIDASESTPDWVVKRCAELGFYGITIAEEYPRTPDVDAAWCEFCRVVSVAGNV